MKILIIDDEKAICNTLKEILLYEKYEVEIANDGVEGVKKAKEIPLTSMAGSTSSVAGA